MTEAESRESKGGTGGSDVGVAVLLAVCAVLGALVGLRASMVGSDAGGDSTAAIRADVKRGAEIVNDAARIYAEDAPLAMQVAEADIRAAVSRETAATAKGVSKGLLTAEAAAQTGLAKLVASSATLVGRPADATKLTVDDLMKRLAVIRAKFPELVNLYPERLANEATDLRRKSSLLVAALIPIAIGFLCGALAEGFPHLTRKLTYLGSVAALAGLVMAIVAEVSI